MQRIYFELRYLLSKPPWDTEISPPELLSYLKQAHPGRAIDLGCGTGTNAVTMAKYGWKVTAVDLSAMAIRRGRRKAKRAGLEIEFHQEDVTRSSRTEGPFDLALDIGCFHGLAPRDRIRYADRLRHLVRAEGDFLLYTFLPSEHLKRWNVPAEAVVRDIFGPWFEILSVDYGQDHDRPSAWFIMRREA